MRLWYLELPQPQQLESARLRLNSESFSYEPDILDGPTPQGMTRETLEVHIGSGRSVYDRARNAIDTWAPFEIEWVGITTGGRPPAAGLDVVVTAARHGFKAAVACRVLATHDVEDVAGARYGFTYGSLQSHLEIGEELFEVVFRLDGSVVYRIDVMARPGRWYTRMARPLVDHYRNQFRSDSAAAMSRIVSA